MVLHPVPPGVSTLPLKFNLLPEARTQYLPNVTGLVLALPLVGAACTYRPAGLSFVPLPLCRGDIGDPWILCNTSVSWSVLLSADHYPLMNWYTPPLYSPCISYHPSRLIGTVTSPSCALVGLPWTSFPVPSSDPPASRLRLRSMALFFLPSATAYWPYASGHWSVNPSPVPYPPLLT